MDGQTLYDRLEALNPDLKAPTVEALLRPNIAPRDYFRAERLFLNRRDGLISLIASYLRERDVDIGRGFTDKAYYTFTPTRGKKPTTYPLLDIVYGRISADYMPKEVFGALNGWEAIYFMAGIWLGRSSSFKSGYKFTRTNLNAWNLREIVAKTIIYGITKLNKYEKILGKHLPHREDILKSAEDALSPQLKLPEKPVKERLGAPVMHRRRIRGGKNSDTITKPTSSLPVQLGLNF